MCAVHLDLRIFLLGVALCAVATVTPSLAQQPFCGAILQHGIRDNENVMIGESRYELAKAIHCSSTVSDSQRSSSASGNIGYRAFGATGGASNADAKKYSATFCSSKYAQAASDSVIGVAVEKINEGIVNAWENCMKDNRGVSHFISPTPDPDQFVYVARYVPFGPEGTTEVLDFYISNATCGSTIAPGAHLNASGTRLLCSRNRFDTVVAVINAGTGAGNLIEATLPAMPKSGTVYGMQDVSVGPNDWERAPPSRGVALDYRAHIVFGHKISDDVTITSIDFRVDWPREEGRNPNSFFVVSKPLNVTSRKFEVMLIKRGHDLTYETAQINWEVSWKVNE